MLFPINAGGGMIDFDAERWKMDHPPGQLGMHVLLPGFISIHKNYLINPFVPGRENRGLQVDERRRPGGAFVQELVRWDTVQEIIPSPRTGGTAPEGRVVTVPMERTSITRVGLLPSRGTPTTALVTEGPKENNVVAITKGKNISYLEMSTEMTVIPTNAEMEVSLRFEWMDRDREADRESQARDREIQMKRQEEADKTIKLMMDLLTGLKGRMDAFNT